jgi:hypothetical protein
MHALGGQCIALAPERQAAEIEFLDELFLRHVALKEQPLRGDRRHDLCRIDLLAGAGDIADRPVAGEEPFAGRIESGAEVFEMQRG